VVVVTDDDDDNGDNDEDDEKIYTKKRCTPLWIVVDENGLCHLFCRLNLSDMVELLITHGADLNSRDRFGETPLQASIYFGCQDNARILIQHGADLDAHDNK
jgi:ankyrin repeat protein